MANPADNAAGGSADDELLTAYLDGALDAPAKSSVESRLAAEPALQRRLDHLALGRRSFGDAYAALLASAPEARLRAQLASAVSAHRLRRTRGRRRIAMLAAAVVVFVAGGLIGGLLTLLVGSGAQEPGGWREVVAEYQALTTAESLKVIPDDPAVLSQELAAIGGKLAVALDADKLALPDAVLKRVDLFAFGEKPLAQLAYLTEASGPVALCIIASQQADAAPAFETREGFNIVFWNDDGRGYMLIGKAPRAALEAWASELAPRV